MNLPHGDNNESLKERARAELIKRHLALKGLSRAQVTAAYYAGFGLPTKEIADKLCVCEKTVKFHLTAIYKKLQIKSRVQLVLVCHEFVDHLPTQPLHNPLPAQAR